jgi:hypothetical protein
MSSRKRELLPNKHASCDVDCDHGGIVYVACPVKNK